MKSLPVSNEKDFLFYFEGLCIANSFCCYCKRRITSEAETGFAPPAEGVIVSAVEFPVGLTMLKTLFAIVVVINLMPTI